MSAQINLKSFFKYSFLILSFIFGVLILTSVFYNSNLFLEIIVSFEPYNIAIGLFLILALIFISILELKSIGWQSFVRKSIFTFMVFDILLLGLVFNVMEVYKFSYSAPVSSEIVTKNQIRVGFYNKYFYNTNFEEISNAINEMDFDILGFGELRQDQPEKISALSNFPYSVSKKCGECEYPEDVALYSKYPILESKLYTFHRARVIEAIISYKEKNIKTFVIHTTAPANIDRYNSRNLELRELPELINKSNEESKIIMGDFNASPWTKSFEEFEVNLNNISNAARGKGLKFTWNTAKVLNSHLDHIFVSKNFTAKSFEVKDSYGSDHRMIYSDLGV